MLFNSVEFTLFLPLVFGLYWLLQNKDVKYQNLLLLLASYFFYGWWDWRFLGLIAFSSVVDFFIGIRLGQEENVRNRQWLLGISVLVNIGLLFFFKYFNFFIENFVEAFSFLGFPFEMSRLSIILPIGISFYTFQTLSYSIDIYYKKIKPTHNLIDFLAFVSFFPQLVAGPIERASNLLPQFFKKRQFNYDQAANGLRQILWGFFKKVVIADNCAVIVNDIFANYETLPGTTLLLGAVYFLIQIYCDFSGYSDIAIGTARLLGFNLMQNFNNPYFSTNTMEFWRRWHISLSTWFRDYIFVPVQLSFRHLRKKAVYVATFITFFLIGIWHGANWTFVIFGLGQSLVLCLELLMKKRMNCIKNSGFPLPIYTFLSWLFTMLYWMFSLVIFRSETITDGFNYISRMFLNFDFSIPPFSLGLTLIGIIFLFFMEWANREYEHGLYKIKLPSIARYSFYFLLLNCILGNLITDTPFIYFQF